MPTNRTFAEFLMPMKRLALLAQDAELVVDVLPVGNGRRICSASGETLQVMRLIGAVADKGEDTLYKAGPL
jgi:hypothetical protein